MLSHRSGLFLAFIVLSSKSLFSLRTSIETRQSLFTLLSSTDEVSDPLFGNLNGSRCKGTRQLANPSHTIIVEICSYIFFGRHLNSRRLDLNIQ